MGDEPSCFQSVVNVFNRLRKGAIGLFRRIIHRGRQPDQPNGIAADSVNPDPVQLQLIRPLEDLEEDVRDRDPLQIYVPRLQIFVPVPPDLPVPPPPPPPFEPPRRRRHSRPAPTYDLATLIEIKDALETLEMSEQLAAENSAQIHENSTRIHENIVISDHTDQSTTSTTSSTKGTKMSATSILRRLP